MEKDRKIKKYSLIALVVALLGLTVVYAAMSSMLKISGSAKVNKSGINVVFEKIQGATITKSNGVLTTLDEPELIKSGLELNLGDITLHIPGDYYQYSINIVNKGKKTAKISGIQAPNITNEALEYITPTFRYENGLDVGVDDTIAPGQYKKIIIKIMLKESITTEQYNSMPKDLELNFNALTITFEKADDSGPGEPVIVDNKGTLASTTGMFTDNMVLFGNSTVNELMAGVNGYRLTFLNTNEQYPGTTGVWDGSENQDGSVTVSYVIAQDNYADIYIGSNGGVMAPADSSYLFVSAVSITNIEYLDTSNVTNMTGMFFAYQGTTLDLSSFDTSNVTSMSGMFLGSASLTSLNLSSFNTENVTDMTSMFGACTALSSIDMRNVTFKDGVNIGTPSSVSMFYDVSNDVSVLVKSSDEKEYLESIYDNLTGVTVYVES